MIIKSNGYKELNLDLSKGRKMEKTHFQFGEDEILLSSKISVGGSLGEVSRCHRMTRRLALLLFIVVLCLPSASSRSGPLGGIILFRRTIWGSTNYFFHCLFYPSPSGLCVLKQRAECIPSVNRQACLAMIMIQLLRSVHPFCSFLCLTNLSSAIQKRCLKQCYTRLNHECTQQDLIYLCKDQLCTQGFKLWHTITKDFHARNTCYLCKFKLNKKYLNART
ncbi:hypothetical protein H5410_023498 [Solanum commersonii]|uniref:Uncharacterized protein n=1 Tax=Solanum commersonii TaxID=4109 RepID=A0A9J5ZH14_SOLCO|nr:hypothetical protein H5410_023498 [Solanum commersonii]